MCFLHKWCSAICAPETQLQKRCDFIQTSWIPENRPAHICRNNVFCCRNDTFGIPSFPTTANIHRYLSRTWKSCNPRQTFADKVCVVLLKSMQSHKLGRRQTHFVCSPCYNDKPWIIFLAMRRVTIFSARPYKALQKCKLKNVILTSTCKNTPHFVRKDMFFYRSTLF